MSGGREDRNLLGPFTPLEGRGFGEETLASLVSMRGVGMTPGSKLLRGENFWVFAVGRAWEGEAVGSLDLEARGRRSLLGPWVWGRNLGGRGPGTLWSIGLGGREEALVGLLGPRGWTWRKPRGVGRG